MAYLNGIGPDVVVVVAVIPGVSVRTHLGCVEYASDVCGFDWAVG